MAASFSRYLESAILSALFRGNALSAPINTYLALYTGDPEVSANELTSINSLGYARVVVAQASWAVPVVDAQGTQITTSAVLEFPGATADWAGPLTHFGILDASSNGNLLFAAALDAPRTVIAGDMLRFSAGALTVRLN